MTIEVNIFDKPSGNVAGVISASMPFGKKAAGITINATLLVDGEVDVSLRVPHRFDFNTLDSLSNMIDDFIAEIKHHI